MLPEANRKHEQKGTSIKTIITATFAVLALVAGGEIQQAQAQLENYVFNGGGTSADLQLDLSGGVAISGSLDILSGPGIGDYNLYTWIGEGGSVPTSSIRVDGGTDLIADNEFNPLDLSLPVDGAGLAFTGGGTDSGGYPNEGFNLSASGNSLNLAGFGIYGYNNPNVDGALTPVATPEPSSAALLSAGGTFAGIALYRRKLRTTAQDIKW
jgi:hypothetical protein